MPGRCRGASRVHWRLATGSVVAAGRRLRATCISVYIFRETTLACKRKSELSHIHAHTAAQTQTHALAQTFKHALKHTDTQRQTHTHNHRQKHRHTHTHAHQCANTESIISHTATLFVSSSDPASQWPKALRATGRHKLALFSAATGWLSITTLGVPPPLGTTAAKVCQFTTSPQSHATGPGTLQERTCAEMLSDPTM